MANTKSTSDELSNREMEEVSHIVSNFVFFTLANKCKSRGQKNMILNSEFLFWIRNEEKLQRYFGGSTAEGTNLPHSDTDKMIVPGNITVCEDKSKASQIKGNTFVSDPSGCQPGYTRLKAVKIETSEYTVFNDHGTTIEAMLEVDKDGTRFLSSDKIVKFWIRFIAQRNPLPPNPECRHGPSVKATTRDTYGYITGTFGHYLEEDFVQAIVFHEWPIHANEWLHRNRSLDWPSQAIMKKIAKLNCHVVGVGDEMAKSSTEWRISYLLQERELVWSFNDTQLQCFILLKKILKQFIEPIAPNVLSSYHMKTILFWVSERNETEIWQPKRLLHCMQICLTILKQCVEESCLKHYIDGRNLLQGRLELVANKDKVLGCIDDIFKNFMPSILQCVAGELSSVWEESKQNVSDFIQLCAEREKTWYTAQFDGIKSSLEQYYLFKGAYHIHVEIVIENLGVLDLYKDVYNKCGPGDVDDYCRQCVQMFINIRRAIIVLSKLLVKYNFNSKTGLNLDKLKDVLKENVNVDALSGKLYLATYFLNIGDYKEINSIIQTVLFSKQMDLIYIGYCSSLRTIIIQEGVVTLRKWCPFPYEASVGLLSVVHDILFSKHDIGFVPSAIKFECVIDKALLIHPLVYMFYLAFLASRNENVSQNYIKNLDDVVKEFAISENVHSFRHLNVLGHCYFLNGDYQKAFECFTDSIKQTTRIPRPNAAVYHLIILIYRLLEKGYHERTEYTEIIYLRTNTNECKTLTYQFHK